MQPLRDYNYTNILDTPTHPGDIEKEHDLLPPLSILNTILGREHDVRRQRGLRPNLPSGARKKNTFMEIKLDDLSGPEMVVFLNEHLRDMIRITPAGSVHALDIEALKKTGITFCGVREGSMVIGCGALKELDSQHAEIKSMRTAASHLGKGVASHLLEYILGEARRRKYQRISLETGSFDAFRPARNLYIKFGFTYCEPFADYIPDSNSVFMMLKLKNKDATGGVG